MARERKTTRVYESTKRIAKPRHDRAATFRKLFEVTVDEATAELTKACRRCTNDCSGLTLDDVVECRQKNYADSNAGLTARLANLFWAFSRRGEQLVYRHAGRRICEQNLCFCGV